MSKYSLILSPNTSGNTKIDVHELCINGESVFEPFVQEIIKGGTSENDLVGALRNLELAADLVRLPETKFRLIRDSSLDCKLYEAKYGSVRIYHFEEKRTGRIIVFGGMKGNQTQDIKSAVRLIKDYHNESK